MPGTAEWVLPAEASEDKECFSVPSSQALEFSISVSELDRVFGVPAAVGFVAAVGTLSMKRVPNTVKVPAAVEVPGMVRVSAGKGAQGLAGRGLS